MTIVSTILSNTLKMADPASNTDLEDGEIESDGEATENLQEEKKDVGVPAKDEEVPVSDNNSQNFYYSKSGKKKKSKSNKGEQKYREKSKKSRKNANPLEEDFAGNIEKAIRKAMNRNEDNDGHVETDVDERRKHKRRKKYENKDGPSKKRKKQDYSDEVDESEMMCVRGASPVHNQSQNDDFQEDEQEESYESDSSQDSRDNHRRHRNQQRERNKNKSDRRRGNHNMQDSEGVCLYFMQGKCHKGDDCIYSHDAHPPRKMELCKFYLMDCCAKRDKCLYMHADFPCKYYHTGLPCVYNDDCKFAHGKPLNENLKNIILKHIESAPKEILGDFPRLNREDAIKMIQTTQLQLKQQYPEESDNQEKSIPSLFEINVPHPQNNAEMINNFNMNNDRSNKISPKVRQSRWQNDQTSNANLSPSYSHSSSVLSIKNLTGVLTPRQILDLKKLGIDNLDQLGQLTVLQLNGIGISLKQITDIQLNTMSIQKLGLINSSEQQMPLIPTGTGSKDLDLRVPPVNITNNVAISTGFPGQDIDMRFQSSVSATIHEDSLTNSTPKQDSQPPKDTIDIDQYTKDALKFASKDKENIDISNDTFEAEKSITQTETKDVDHRVLPYTDAETKFTTSSINENAVRLDGDTDIRFLQPDPIFKNPARRNRRSTTDDDEENNLLIDEKWYSSDEEKGSRKKSPNSTPQKGFMSPPATPAPHVIEPSSVLSKIGDLSKIDISEEVTKLLNTMKNNMHENTSQNNQTESVSVSRDPRSKRSPDKTAEAQKLVPQKKQSRISIYDCVVGEPTDGRRRSDVDLRQSEFKPTFGDTDLRQSAGGDIDLRLSLPFKAIPNYTPASEINGSINNHPPIQYKLVSIFIPRPDYTDIKNSTAKSQALVDPRLRKVFRLSTEEFHSDSEKPTTKTAPVSSGPRVDPRRKPKEPVESVNVEPKPNALDLQAILQNSNWYKDLSSTQKIFVNQNLAPVTQQIKHFHQDKTPGKQFDLAAIQSSSILCGIFTNLGITLGENAEFSLLPKPKEALLKTPINFNPNPIPFGANNMNPSGGMEPGMNMMNGPPMGMGGGMNNMNVGHMHGFNQSMSGNGPTPGLLGIAPNIPHNFNNNKFGPPNNFGNMGYNGPGNNDFNYMEEQNFQRFPHRGGHRGRGNDRWNRGGSNRGQRDRKNFNDRGNWKNK
ncbi:unnamed protein product [Pieris brassicae]|uniref:C3H1-type domain-containing protein n=1 Tax=Pieris brassicae TaxID=7116 RepID=A0A9P0XAC6_PIEBR|nr:unnamed protein product [Pieris brassicae]